MSTSEATTSLYFTPIGECIHCYWLRVYGTRYGGRQYLHSSSSGLSDNMSDEDSLGHGVSSFAEQDDSGSEDGVTAEREVRTINSYAHLNEITIDYRQTVPELSIANPNVSGDEYIPEHEMLHGSTSTIHTFLDSIDVF